MPKISFDYAVMENCKDLKVIPAAFTWSDVGTFSGLHHLHKTIIKDCGQGSNYIQSKAFKKES